MKRAALAVVVPCLALVLAGWPSDAHAWTPISGEWPVWCQSVPYAMNSAGSADLGAGTTESETKKAFEDWTEVSCADISLQWNGTTAANPGAYEGSSVVGWIEAGWPHDPNAIGITGPVWAFDSTRNDYCMEEADMLLNGVNFSWSTAPGAGASVNAYSILLHEAGHYYGLGHSQSPAAAMYFAYGGGTDTIKADDEMGICSLYPDGASPQDCSTLGCPAGQDCVGGTCTTVVGDGSVCSVCATDGDCDDDGYCLQYPDGARYCGKSCAGEGDCPGDADYCVDVGGSSNQCVQFDNLNRPDCATSGGSEVECVVDTDCAENELCDTESGECGPRPTGGADLGDACDAADACDTRLCLSSASGGVCTLTCDWLEPGSCPAGFYCSASVTGFLRHGPLSRGLRRSGARR